MQAPATPLSVRHGPFGQDQRYGPPVALAMGLSTNFGARAGRSAVVVHGPSTDPPAAGVAGAAGRARAGGAAATLGREAVREASRRVPCRDAARRRSGRGEAETVASRLVPAVARRRNSGVGRSIDRASIGAAIGLCTVGTDLRGGSVELQVRTIVRQAASSERWLPHPAVAKPDRSAAVDITAGSDRRGDRRGRPVVGGTAPPPVTRGVTGHGLRPAGPGTRTRKCPEEPSILCRVPQSKLRRSQGFGPSAPSGKNHYAGRAGRLPSGLSTTFAVATPNSRRFSTARPPVRPQ